VGSGDRAGRLVAQDPARVFGTVARVNRRVTRRLIPFLFLLYVVAFLDRVNVGFAALQMKQDLGFGDAVYGLGAGIFFIGYFLFEVPSNLILERVGPRYWIARIMISWGVVSSAMAFVHGEAAFYALRFLLGVAEAGFFPGIVLYLTYWFPAAERARAVALFMTATAMSGVVGGPLSGALLELDGALGFRGWQWLFVVEGLPAVALGLVVLRFLTDRPEDAHWLPADERRRLVERLAAERAAVASRHGVELRWALAHPRVWALALLYFAIVVGLYGVTLWLPQIVRELGERSALEIGLVTAIPYLAASLAMVVVGARSDRSGERRGHLAGSALVGAAGFALTATLEVPPAAAIALLSLAAAGVWGCFGPFWALPGSFLAGSAAAGGIALINSIGNLGGFAGPYALGLLREATGDFRAGLGLLALSLSAVALLALRLPRGDAPPRD
jgi:MFS transporter, ACS family, tartrate transporter